MKRFFLIWVPVFLVLLFGRDIFIAPAVRMFVVPAAADKASEAVMYGLMFFLGPLIMMWPQARPESSQDAGSSGGGAVRTGAYWMGIVWVGVVVAVAILGNQAALEALKQGQAPEGAFFALGCFGLGGAAVLVVLAVERLRRK